MDMIKVDNLTKKYGKGESQVIAINHVSFTVSKGEFVSVLGPSGSGKSTLLHLLGGVDRPDCGTAIIDGVDIFSLNERNLTIFRRKYIGLIYQFYNLIPILNVEENILLPLLLDGQKPDPEMLNEMIQILGLVERKTHLPNQLSGGQQQRTAIGRALIMRPSIILADEPTGNLDQKHTQEIMGLFQKMNQIYGQTIIMITHDLELALQSSRILYMEDGELVKEKKVPEREDAR